MENQIIVGEPNTQKVWQKPDSQPTNIQNNPRINYWMISSLILAVLFIGNLGVYVFFVRQTNQPASTITPTSTQLPPSNEFACFQDNDCVVGIQATSCCSCPQAVNKALISTEDWQLYEPGKDYSSQKPEVCDQAGICQPCEPLTQPVCQNGQCRFTLKDLENE